MKKIIALVAVCGFAFAFTACGKKAEETTVEETTPTTEQSAPVATDSAAVMTDSTATDSTAH